MNRHLTTDELLDQFYGIGGPKLDAHIGECPECAARYQKFEARRCEVTAEPEISNISLVTQRRAIYARIESDTGSQTRWTPALAAALLLVVGIFLYRPLTDIGERQPVPAKVEISDDQLFTDVYSMAESAEPRAGAPIQALFESGSESSGESQN
jgi:hypothetical protein